MNWNDPIDKLPKQSGSVIISIDIPHLQAVSPTFYVAYFNRSDSNFYKYDPFDENYTPNERIEKIRGWADVPTFLGTVRIS
jgi:hypothetical protein